METVAEIKKEVLRTVGRVIKGDATTVDILSFMNKGLKEIAGQFLLPKLLETENTVETYVSEAYTELPDDFMKNLHYCYSSTNNRKIKIYDDTRLLFREFSQLDLSGSVVGVAVRGNDLCYQRIPASVESLRIHYYKYPTVLTTGDDTPDCLPDFLVRPLMVNYVVKELFSIIDTGPAASDNTIKHQAQFDNALMRLKEYIGPENREPQYIYDDVNLEGYL